MPDATPTTDLNIPALESALAQRTIGRRIHHYDLIGSTMDEARRLALEGAEEGTVVIAEEQTAGRGRFNRAWVSPRGENLSFSVILDAARKPASLYEHGGDSRGRTARSPTLPDVQTHYQVAQRRALGAGGLKISGILIETAIESEGRRVRHHRHRRECELRPFTLLRDCRHLHKPIPGDGQRRNRTPVLQTLLEHFDDAYGAVRAGKSLTADWSAMLDTLGRTVTLRSQHDTIEGIAESVDEQGNLLVRQARRQPVHGDCGRGHISALTNMDRQDRGDEWIIYPVHPV